MTIVFVHPHRALLPEIEAYTDFFTTRGLKTLVCHPARLHEKEADVEWHFMGLATRRHPGRVVIHEYASASVPPLAGWKDLLKKWLAATPDFRIFNNQYVQSRFAFRDGIPQGIRDYGIPRDLPLQGHSAGSRAYDFVYAGSVEKKRNLEPLFACFTHGSLKGRSLLVLSRDYHRLSDRLKKYPNISFQGPLLGREYFQNLCLARYAINYIPDRLPFREQTSAKMIDYGACRIPVISTDYGWARGFQQQYGGKYCFVKGDLSDLNWERVSGFEYGYPDTSQWIWENQIRRSGVLDMLESKFKGLHLRQEPPPGAS